MKFWGPVATVVVVVLFALIGVLWHKLDVRNEETHCIEQNRLYIDGECTVIPLNTTRDTHLRWDIP